MNPITIVMPTRERQAFMLRGVSYWGSLGVRLIVADGSEEALSASTIGSFPPNVTYLHSIENLPSRLATASAAVKTKFVAMVSDDEFFLRSGLVRCVRFLDQERDFVSCTGRAISIEVSESGLSWGTQYPEMAGRVLDAHDASTRVTQHFSHYTPVHVWSVIRTDVWKSAVNLCNQQEFRLYAQFELQLEYLVSFAGKSCVLPQLMWVRSKENASIVDVEPGLDSASKIGDLWSNPLRWQEKQRFVDLVADSSRAFAPSLSVDDLRKIVVQSFSRYHMRLNRVAAKAFIWQALAATLRLSRISLLNNAQGKPSYQIKLATTLDQMMTAMSANGVEFNCTEIKAIETRIYDHHFRSG